MPTVGGVGTMTSSDIRGSFIDRLSSNDYGIIYIYIKKRGKLESGIARFKESLRGEEGKFWNRELIGGR